MGVFGNLLGQGLGRLGGGFFGQGDLGQNVGGITTNTGNSNTGDSANALLVPTATPVTTTLPFRIIDVVRDTQTVGLNAKFRF